MRVNGVVMAMLIGMLMYLLLVRLRGKDLPSARHVG